MRRLLIALLLLVPTFALAVDTTTDNKTFTYGLRLYLNGRYADNDSGDVAAAYPTSEDTTGKRQSLTWIGGAIRQWDFTPDSSEVYTIYARASCCSDTAIAGLTGRYFQGSGIPEGFIASSRAFDAGVVSTAAMAANAVTTAKISGDSLKFGATLAAADSLAAAVVIQKWTVVGAAYLFTHTLADADATDTVKVPGARAWDTFAIATPTVLATDSVSSVVSAICSSNGEIVLTRISTSGAVTVLVRVWKDR